MTEREALLILNAVPGLGNRRIGKFIERFGSAQNVLGIKPIDVADQGALARDIAGRIIRFPKDRFLKTEYALIKEHKARVIVFGDADYPALLREIPDAPLVLYWKGALKAVDSLTVAVVGSRQASFYGLTLAEKISRELAALGITIVSGMARGIDTAAHTGALKAGGFTIAVLGCGLSHTYAVRNRKLFDRLSESGAVISEFPMTEEPRTYHFPRRNRIISGLSLGVIIVEAFKRSGALITSRLAAEQGREVFAFPGNVNHPNAQGTNHLIQQGAKLISGVDDVLEEIKTPLRELLKPRPSAQESVSQEISTLSDEERRVYQIIKNNPLIHIDTIVNQCSMSLSRLSPILLGLELKHCIKQLPGKLYVKT